MTSEVSELLPCPFCQRKVECSYNGPTAEQAAVARGWGYDIDWQWYGECTHCGAIGPSCQSKTEAIAAWNRRAEARQEPTRPAAVTEEEALAGFTEYFVKNYPPDTLIYKPDWHAPRIFRAAKHFIEAAFAARPAETVAIRPLEWRVPTDNPKDPDIEENVLCADGIGGVYAISKKQKVGPERLLWMADDPFVWNGFNSIAEAKAAAQADYEQRIRSALLSTPQPAGEAVTPDSEDGCPYDWRERNFRQVWREGYAAGRNITHQPVPGVVYALREARKFISAYYEPTIATDRKLLRDIDAAISSIDEVKG